MTVGARSLGTAVDSVIKAIEMTEWQECLLGCAKADFVLSWGTAVVSTPALRDWSRGLRPAPGLGKHGSDTSLACGHRAQDAAEQRG